MIFSIIAAGEGSRLASEGVSYPKPLVPLLGEPLIDRLVRLFGRCGAERIVVICNEEMTEVADHLHSLQRRPDLPPIELVVRSTPSSMHSFYALAPYLEGGPFCLTTVDTVFAEAEFRRYIEAFRSTRADALMAVTSFVDDEKPLYVGTDEAMRVTGFHDSPVDGDHFVSGGMYCLRPATLATLRRCIEAGMSRMRNFQRALVADGWDVRAYAFKKIIDVDHKADIVAAEALLKTSVAP